MLNFWHLSLEQFFCKVDIVSQGFRCLSPLYFFLFSSSHKFSLRLKCKNWNGHGEKLIVSVEQCNLRFSRYLEFFWRQPNDHSSDKSHIYIRNMLLLLKVHDSIQNKNDPTAFNKETGPHTQSSSQSDLQTF